jgi:hypothetical protein
MKDRSISSNRIIGLVLLVAGVWFLIIGAEAAVGEVLIPFLNKKLPTNLTDNYPVLFDDRKNQKAGTHRVPAFCITQAA